MWANWKDFWYEFWKQKRLFSVVFFPFLAAYIFPWTDQRQLTVVIFGVKQERVDDNFLLAKISNFTNNVHFFSFRILQNKQSPPFVQVCLIWCCPSSLSNVLLYSMTPQSVALLLLVPANHLEESVTNPKIVIVRRLHFWVYFDPASCWSAACRRCWLALQLPPGPCRPLNRASQGLFGPLWASPLGPLGPPGIYLHFM